MRKFVRTATFALAGSVIGAVFAIGAMTIVASFTAEPVEYDLICTTRDGRNVVAVTADDSVVAVVHPSRRGRL